MAWIELHQTLPTHRKTLAAADLLDMPPVHILGHLAAFWLWALDNTHDGSLRDISPRTIARAAQWEGKPDVLVSALEEVGFFDRVDGTLAIHDWDDYAGKLISRRTAERDRSRLRRTAFTPQVDRRSTRKRPAVDQEKACGTVPYRTVPNSTYNESRSSVDDRPVDNSDVSQSRADEATKRPITNGESLEVKAASGTAPTRTVDRSTTRADKDSFDSFWAAYPKKVGKGAAEAAWRKLKPDGTLTATIIAAVERAKTSRQWLRDGGQYIPNPATWLNQRRWEDEPDTKPRASPAPTPQSPRLAGQSTAMYDTDSILMARIDKYAAEHPDEDEEE